MRLTLWYTGLLALTFIILGVAAYLLVSYTLHKDVDSALRGVAEAVAENRSNTHRFPPGADEIFRRFFGSFPAPPYFEWLEPGRNMDREVDRAHVPPLRRQARANAVKGVATFETVKGIERYPVRVLTWPVVDAGRVVGVIRVGMSQMELSRTLSHFLLIMAGLFPVALALAGGGGWLLASRALGPVDSMTRTARKIKAARLNERLVKSGANDELDRLADTLNDMLARLESAFTEMRQFTADASHELQTPLTILRGEIEVALRTRRNPEEYEQVLKSALEEVDRISRLVEGLLLLARSDSGVLRLDMVPVDLVTEGEDVLARLTPMARARGVNIGLGGIQPVDVMADAVHVRRLLFNLVDNAIKYTPAGGTVRLSIGRTGPWSFIMIEDTGIGIPPDEQEKIFQRFYRSPEDRSGMHGGSGLGLSLVKSIVDAHGGKIEVKSTPGEGSTFTVFLPAQPSVGVH
jgi:heavy metal sensor kinase